MIDGVYRNVYWLAGGWAMIYFLLMGSLVGLAAALARNWLPTSSPEIRYRAALTFLATLALIPVLLLATFVGRAFRFPSPVETMTATAFDQTGSPTRSSPGVPKTNVDSAAPAELDMAA